MPAITPVQRCVQCNIRLPKRDDNVVVREGAVFVLDPRLCDECAWAPLVRPRLTEHGRAEAGKAGSGQ